MNASASASVLNSTIDVLQKLILPLFRIGWAEKKETNKPELLKNYKRGGKNFRFKIPCSSLLLDGVTDVNQNKSIKSVILWKHWNRWWFLILSSAFKSWWDFHWKQIKHDKIDEKAVDEWVHFNKLCIGFSERGWNPVYRDRIIMIYIIYAHLKQA